MKQPTEIAEMSGVELLAHYRDKRLSPVEVTEDALARIERFNPQVNAYCHVDQQGALDAARASEQRWLKGQPCGALDGVPASIKDLTLTRGMPTRKGSKTTSGTGALGSGCALPGLYAQRRRGAARQDHHARSSAGRR